MKEYLTTREVAFDSINVAADADGREALRQLGFRSVPVLARGDVGIYAQDLADINRLLDLDGDVSPTLSPTELIERYCRVLDKALGLALAIPAERLDDTLPGRDRRYLSLVNHLFAIAEGFAMLAEGANAGVTFTDELARAEPDPQRPLANFPALCVNITSRLRAWLATNPDAGTSVTTYYGNKSLHNVLERCTWHSTQHTRQLMMVLSILGIEPANPLDDADLAGLPLPTDVWD